MPVRPVRDRSIDAERALKRDDGVVGQFPGVASQCQIVFEHLDQLILLQMNQTITAKVVGKIPDCLHLSIKKYDRIDNL
ncbi:MAG TPA: hypothetical protein PKE65_02420, partial [Rhizobiaceae bacterium]|nr:hypothetical protein [Rhizobiaceae bacterium]